MLSYTMFGHNHHFSENINHMLQHCAQNLKHMTVIAGRLTMGLKLSLKPGERIAINGAVLTNGDRRCSFVVENRARLLRESDIMQPEDATTPASRIYLPVMMMYLDPEQRHSCHAEFADRLTEFLDVVSDLDCKATCLTIAAQVANEDYYKALCNCRELMAYEKERLSNVA